MGHPLQQVAGTLACVSCPFQSRGRWVETKRRWPELFGEVAEIDYRLRGRLALDKTPYLYMLRMPLNEAVALDGAEMGRGGLSCYMRDYRRRAKPRFKWRGWRGVARPRYSVRSR